jgi:thioredoxin-like negative regulator of GroEL
MNVWLIVGSIVSLIIISYLAYKYYFVKDPKLFVPNDEFIENDRTSCEILLFYVTWCPYCQDTMTVWNEYKNTYDQTKYKVAFVENDCDVFPTIADSYNVENYPTIILVRDGKKYEFDATLTPDAMDKFINTIMGS